MIEINPTVRKVEPVHKITKTKKPKLDQRIEKYEENPVLKDIERQRKILNIWL
tara:strand:+ start:313 stop:471 length:159 start_codon:yes stop_codon:yes gene_type:complete